MEMKPCPIRGKQPTTTHLEARYEPYWIVECESEEDYPPHTVAAFSERNGTLEQATKVWNTRHSSK